MGRAPMTDPGCKAYKDSDCDLKTNERSLAKNMPLLIEFPRYADWGTDAERWEKMFYIHPISTG